MRIPYGRSNFEEIRQQRYFYVDKTPFLPLLERPETGYPVFLRPRRFGKSTLLSTLEHYYDLGRKERFDDLFGGLWVHEHPTPERNAYLVLTLDFSTVATDGGPDTLRQTFFRSVRSRMQSFLLRYRDLIQPLAALHDKLDAFEDAGALLGEVLDIVSTTHHKVYVLIDEYDHFANRLLSGGSQDVYEALVKRTGFIRTFYATLKAGTGAGAIRRMFITGVTPLLLDDLSSGFNIATPIWSSPRFNALAGFTRADVERAWSELAAACPHLAEQPHLGNPACLLDAMESHYGGYRFSTDATEQVFNPDMVLYFLRELYDRGRWPDDMLDPSVRAEYRDLQRIGALTGITAFKRREILDTILLEGHIRSELVRGLGVKGMLSSSPFISLLYHLGLLTLRAAPPDPIGYDLEIPNRVVHDLQWESLALMMHDQNEKKLFPPWPPEPAASEPKSRTKPAKPGPARPRKEAGRPRGA